MTNPRSASLPAVPPPAAGAQVAPASEAPTAISLASSPSLDAGSETPPQRPTAPTSLPYASTAFGAEQWEREVLRRMIELREAGFGYHAIANRFNEQGIPTKNGGAWWPYTIRIILKRHRPDLCPPRRNLDVPQHQIPNRHRDRDRRRRRRAYERSEAVA